MFQINDNLVISIFTTFEKQSMINRLSNHINHNCSAAKISTVMSSTGYPPKVMTSFMNSPLFQERKNTLGGVTKTWPAAILTLEQNPPERMFKMYIKNSRERILLWSQNCCLPSFRYTALFLLVNCFLPASPNFGQAKHSQKHCQRHYGPRCWLLWPVLFGLVGVVW